MRWPGCAAQLNQDPYAQGMKTKADSPCLHTLIANCSLIMSDVVKPARWLLPTEALLSQGFPLLPGCRDDEDDVLLGPSQVEPTISFLDLFLASVKCVS